MSIYLTYRWRRGKKHGPYAYRGTQYIGAVTVQGMDVFLKSSGEFVGQLVRRAEIPKKKEEPLHPTVETVIQNMFDLPLLTLLNINDIKRAMQPQFSGEVINAAIMNLTSKGILKETSQGNYVLVI